MLFKIKLELIDSFFSCYNIPSGRRDDEMKWRVKHNGQFDVQSYMKVCWNFLGILFGVLRCLKRLL